MNKEKNITLICLGNSRKDFAYLPGFLFTPSPGIHYMAEFLSNDGFNVSIIDQVSENFTLDEVKSLLNRSESNIFLFTQFYNTRGKIRDAASVIQKNCIIGIGGHDATFHSSFLLNRNNPSYGLFKKKSRDAKLKLNASDAFQQQYDHADFVWQGESESGLAQFLRTFSKRQDGPIAFNNLANRVADLDTLPILEHGRYHGDTGSIVTSRGCLKRGCDFCTTPQFYADGWKGRSISHVEKELHNLKESGKKFVYFMDDNFLGLTKQSVHRGFEIILLCKQMNLKCFFMTSANQILIAESLGILNRFTGTVTKILLGVENFNTVCIKKLGKRYTGINHQQNSLKAIQLLLRHGVYPYLGYINFQPHSTLDELANSARLLYENHQLAACFNNLFSSLIILEGTPLFYKYLKDRTINADSPKNEISGLFHNNDVKLLWSLLNMFSYKNRILDYLDNEAMKLIYMNQIQDSSIGEECKCMRDQINEMNYSFFISCIEKIKRGDALNLFIDASAISVDQLQELIVSYKALFQPILKNAEFTLEEPLGYINSI